jgi:hypothetical protein
MNLSNHAVARCRERGIPEALVDVVLRYGKPEYHRGKEIFALDKKGRRDALRYLGSLYKGSEDALKGVYVVTQGETVVTAARKTTHHKRARH